jgi:hypothetical protein
VLAPLGSISFSASSWCLVGSYGPTKHQHLMVFLGWLILLGLRWLLILALGWGLRLQVCGITPVCGLL